MARQFADDRVQVRGLAQFQKELRQLGAEWPKELRAVNRQAAEFIAARARGKALSQGSVAAKTAPFIKSQAEQRYAMVKLGGARAPFALGAEFGSMRYRQFKPWKGNKGDAGYFLYPTIRDESDDLAEHYGDALERLAKSAFPD